MRLTRSPLLVHAAVIACILCSSPLGGNEAQAEPEPQQIRVQLETVTVRGEGWVKTARHAVHELLGRGWVAGATAAELRGYLAHVVASGRASVTEAQTASTRLGVPVSIKASQGTGQPGLTATLYPRQAEGEIVADLALSYGPSGRKPKLALPDRIKVQAGELIAVRVPGMAESSTEQFVILKLTHVAKPSGLPKGQP